jgi:DNA primase
MTHSVSSGQTRSSTEEIKAKLDIADVLRGYLTLIPAGKNFKALCPFHHEKTPSFIVSPDRQTWHCFGCSLGGDVFSFVMRHDSLEFGEALKILAEKAGVELKRMSPADYEQFGLLYDINDEAKRFFKNQLQTVTAAKDYIVSRGLKQETIEEFDLGWAPNLSESLTLHLINQSFRPEALVRAGLVFRNANGMHLDRFRGRIMFPIHNNVGKVVGFTGRILPQLDTGEMGKYVNSPETPIFVKSRVLYGLHKSKGTIRDQGKAFLVEGQMDCLMAYQAGIKNVVATSGTALTLDHLHLLRKLTDQIILNFDSDEAGIQAGERAIDLAVANDFNVRVVIFPPGTYKDAAEAVQADPQGFLNLIQEAVPAIQFYFDRFLPSGSNNATGSSHIPQIKKGVRLVLGKIRNLSSPVERQAWLRELSHRVSLDASSLADEMEQLDTASVVSERKMQTIEETAPNLKSLSRRELVGLHLLASAAALGKLEAIKESVPYFLKEHQEVYALLEKGENHSVDPGLDELLNTIYLLPSAGVQEKDILELAKHLKEEFLKEHRKKLEWLIKNAERDGDEASLRRALEELKESWSL